MATLFNSLAFAFDGLMASVSWIHPLAGIVLLSALTAVLVLIIYKYLSNQAAIQATKARIKADFLAISLYKDSIRVLFSSAGRILWANLNYVRLNLVPLLFMILPVSIIMANLEPWYGYRPLAPGEKTLVEVKFEPSVDITGADIDLHVPEGVRRDLHPVRIVSQHEIDWRVAAEQPGEYRLRLSVGSLDLSKSLVAGKQIERISVKRHRGDLWDWFLYSGESTIPETSPVRSVTVAYPAAELDLFGWQMHWMIFYFLLTLILALALKGVFKVTL